MLTNYLKMALRNLLRQRGYSLINILGLSVGLTVSLLILLWVQDELKIDRFHAGGDRLYRILANLPGETGVSTWETTPYPLLDYLPENYPEIEDIGAYDPTNQKEFKVDDRGYLADGIFATAGFFRLLSFPVLEGDGADLFAQPNSVAISSGLAGKLFGNGWQGKAVGKSVTINGRPDYRISGVFADVPAHSSLDFDFVLSLDEQHPPDMNGFPWGNFDSRILLKVGKEADAAVLADKMKKAVSENNEYAEDLDLILQPFERMYLHGAFENGREAGGRIEYVRLFGLAAAFLMLIACINFMNLATARASRRAKEVGVRKTVGAGRGALVAQFLLEAALVSAISLTLAVVLSRSLLPFFQELSGKELAIDLSSWELWGLIAVVGLLTALVAGSYPAFFLSSFRIANVIKGDRSSQFGGSQLRRGLVVFQFALSTLLVVSALVVRSQVDFIKSKHLGLNKENVLYFRTPPGASEDLETFRTELLRIPGVQRVTYADANPLSIGSQTGDPKWEGMAPDDGLLFHVMIADEYFLQTMEIPLADGRDFSPLLSIDSMSFLINETAARAMKLDDPLGRRLEFWGVSGQIVGVVKDFHLSSLHTSISPLIIANMPSETGMSLLRIEPGRTDEVLAATRKLFGAFAQGHPFRYDFLDDRYLEMYRSEQRTSALSKWFALVALFISCLGLLGLSAFIAEQKTKEIGIRKVLGASVFQITAMLSREFLKLVLLSLFIALPLGWYLMDRWLEDFAYRVNVPWWAFVLAGSLALTLAIFTVSFQSIKAALTDPVKSLKRE